LPASKYFSDRGSKLHRLMKILKLNGIAWHIYIMLALEQLREHACLPSLPAYILILFPFEMA
jgi:hypothetical protein